MEIKFIIKDTEFKEAARLIKTIAPIPRDLTFTDEEWVTHCAKMFVLDLIKEGKKKELAATITRDDSIFE